MTALEQGVNILVPSLKHISKLVFSHNLLDLFSIYHYKPKDEECRELESEEVLSYLLRTYKERMTVELITCLAPACLRELNLDLCLHLTADDVLKILQKCSALRVLSLSQCETLSISGIVNVAQPLLTSLITLNLTGCRRVTDHDVHVVLKTSHNLQHLSLAETKITDKAFLLDLAVQHQLEMTGRSRSNGRAFLVALVSVDLSGCLEFTNDGLLHLCSLSGPTLRSVDVQATKVDFQGLLYLAGHSRLSAIALVRLAAQVHNKRTSLSDDVDACAGVSLPNSTAKRTSSESESVHKVRMAAELPAEKVPEYDEAEGDVCGGVSCDASGIAPVTVSSCDASGIAPVTVSSCDAFNIAPVTVSSCDAFNIAPVTVSICDVSSIAPVTVSSCDASSIAPFTVSSCNATSIAPVTVSSCNATSIAPVTGSSCKATSIAPATLPSCSSSLILLGNNSDDGKAHSCLQQNRNKETFAEDPDQQQSLLHVTIMHEACVVRDIDRDRSSADSVARTLSEMSRETTVGKTQPIGSLNYSISTFLEAQGPTNNGSKTSSLNVLAKNDEAEVTCSPDSLQGFPFVKLGATANKNGLSNAKTASALKKQSDHTRSTTVSTTVSGQKSCLTADVWFDASLVRGNCQKVNVNSERASIINNTIKPLVNLVENGYSEKDTTLDPDTYESCSILKTETSSQATRHNTHISKHKENNGREQNGDSNSKLESENKTSFYGFESIKPPLTPNYPPSVKKAEDVISTDHLKFKSSFPTLKHKHTAHTLHESAGVSSMSFLASRSQISGPPLMFQPKLTSVAFSFTAKINSPDSSKAHRRFILGCFEALLRGNPSLKALRIRSSEPDLDESYLRRLQSFCADIYSQMLRMIGRLLPHLQQLSFSQEDIDFHTISDDSVSDVLRSCSGLAGLELEGCFMLSDNAFEQVEKNASLVRLHVPASLITNSTFFLFHLGQTAQLTSLDLSWCEAVETNDLNAALTSCPHLAFLSLRCCKVTNETLATLADHCPAIQQLDISGAANLEDFAVVQMAQSLRCLTKLDIGRNTAVGDQSVKALLTYCHQLQRLNLSCLQYVTSEPFLPLVNGGRAVLEARQSNLGSDRRSLEREQQLVAIKPGAKSYRGQSGSPFTQIGKFKRFTSLRRSTSYGQSLELLDLTYCANVREDELKNVVTACRGGLQIIDYYCRTIRAVVDF